MESLFALYGLSLLRGFFITIFLLATTLFFNRHFRVSKKSTHHSPSTAFRFGGIALVVGFLLALLQVQELFFPMSWWVFGGALLLVLVVGLWDDIKNLNWKYQLGAQIIFLSTLYIGGVKILSLTNPSGGVFTLTNDTVFSAGFFIFLAWGLLITNALNWLDGVDGLAGSVMVTTYLTLFFLVLSPAVNQPALAIFLATAVGGTLAFLVYNHPPAKIIAGTSGSLFFGLSIVFVSVVAGAKIATTLLVLALPITDTVFVLVKRVIQKRSIFAPDQGHLHHVLRKRGWSDQKIIASYVLLTALIGITAVHTQNLGKLVSIVGVFSILSLVLVFLHFGKKLSRLAVGVSGALIGVLFLAFIIYSAHFAPVRNVLIQGTWYQLEVAGTESERIRGLSGREELCARCGMIFLFPEGTMPSFWMKDMHFSIDILWVQDGLVVSKNENLPYPSLQKFSPPSPVNTVIELSAGAAKDIPIGTKVYFW